LDFKSLRLNAIFLITSALILLCTTSCCDLKFATDDRPDYASTFHSAVAADSILQSIMESKSAPLKDINVKANADACGNVYVYLGRISNVSVSNGIYTVRVINADQITPIEIKEIASVVAEYAWIWDYHGNMTVYQVKSGKNVVALRSKIKHLVSNDFKSERKEVQHRP